jgi:serine/threonine protein kinase
MATIGSYQVVRQIGEGGFAYTYEARHVLLDEKACLKQCINISVDDAALLRNEAKLLWNVHHYALPAMRDYFITPDGSHVMAMSFIEGKTLEAAVKKHTAIHPEDVCWMSQRLLNALHYLHSLGIVHGDVKPPNVIVQPQMHNAVLVDYGLASIRPKATTKPVGFTQLFAAPEILQGKPPLPESDLYSLGLTMLYAMGGDIVARVHAPSVPAQLQGFCNDLLRQDPLARPNWGTQDLVARLSDVRLELFGRRTTK